MEYANGHPVVPDFAYSRSKTVVFAGWRKGGIPLDCFQRVGLLRVETPYWRELSGFSEQRDFFEKKRLEVKRLPLG